MRYQITHYINGQYAWDQKRLLPITNPANAEVIGHVAMADQAMVAKAVLAASAAFPAWSQTTPARRIQILFQFKTLIEKHLEALARCITQEHGKTLADARASILRGLDVVEFVCGLPYLLKGSYAENVATDMDSYSLRQPLGVCVGITPFNFPAMIPLWMFPMAIACGNTFVLKPSEKNPSCAMRLAELALEAGLPAGVLNVVHGDQEAVDALIIHPDVQAISFVGSSAIAEKIYLKGTAHGKRVQAFGGAKNHCVIMPDAPLDQAVDAMLGAAYGSAGERCMAISVAVLVGDALAERFIKKIKPRIQALSIGPGILSKVEMGPLISEAHWLRVQSYIDSGIAEGATLIVDGRHQKPQGHESGYFMGGSLFDHVLPTMKIYQEEIFGPVLCLVRVPDFESALHLVNEHTYGNGTAIFTRAGDTARRFAHQVQAGMVGINVPIPVPVAYQSFGGWKRSFFGDIALHGMEGVHFNTKIKVVTQRWYHDQAAKTEFTLPHLK